MATTRKSRNHDANGNLYGKESRARAVLKYRQEHNLVAYSITMKQDDRDKFKRLMSETGKTQFELMTALLACFNR